MKKYTIGPWRVDPHTGWIVADNVQNGPMHVADVRGWGYLTGLGHGARGFPSNEAAAIMEANATLIAAAPALYEALANLTERYVELVGSGDCGSWDPEKEQIVKDARASLEAAVMEGEDG